MLLIKHRTLLMCDRKEKIAPFEWKIELIEPYKVYLQ